MLTVVKIGPDNMTNTMALPISMKGVNSKGGNIYAPSSMKFE